MKNCDRCNKEIYLGMVCQEKDCIYIETYCGLEPFTTGDYDPFYQSGACGDHDINMSYERKSPFGTALEFTVDVLNTAVINTAKAVYSVTFAVPYILVGAVGGFFRHITRGKK